jgi:hypothetical protein
MLLEKLERIAQRSYTGWAFRSFGWALRSHTSCSRFKVKEYCGGRGILVVLLYESIIFCLELGRKVPTSLGVTTGGDPDGASYLPLYLGGPDDLLEYFIRSSRL